MKIGVHIPIIDPKVGGGFTFQQVVLRAVLEEAANAKHEFVIYTNSPDSAALVPASRKVEFALAQRSPVVKVLNKIQDVIFEKRLFHFESHFERDVARRGVDLVWFVTPESLECRAPYIFTLWDLAHRLMPWFPEVSQKGEWQRREAAYARAFSRATKIIVVNEQGKTELMASYGIAPERILPLPLPTPEFALAAGPASGDFGGTLEKYGVHGKFIFYPAQFWPHKNHANLLFAMKSLKARGGLDFKLVCVGSDHGAESYVSRLAAELGLSENIKIIGFVPTEDLAALYRHAFALVFPTFFGPENLPPLEAFALGCPVIASNVPGAETQLADAALLFDPTKPEEIASALERLSADAGLRERLIKAGKARAAKWTGRDYVRAVLDFVDEFERVRRSWR